jgi:AcrR family transcriptional regulator
LFVSAVAAAPDTKDRLLAAAAGLFAERGFQRTTIRDIAARAGVNVAAGHYHYGSKRALYLEVLRAQFAAIRARLAAEGATPPPPGRGRPSRRAREARFRARVEVVLGLLIGPPPGMHGTLMQREMCDPSEALPVIVDEFIRPMVAEMAAIVGELAPGLDPGAVERAVFSVMGQALFYRFTMPATLRMLGLPAYPRGLARELAGHVSEFSLGGLARLARARPARRRGRRGR